MNDVMYTEPVTAAFIGIDLAIAKGKHLPVVVSTLEDGCLIPQKLRRLRMVPPRGAGNVAVLDPDWRLRFATETRRYIVEVCEQLALKPERIAIDAPRSPCDPSRKRRAAEVALDNNGISCFATPSAAHFELIIEKVNQHLAFGGPENRIPNSNQLWMLAGFTLFQELSKLAECIEVYPQATVRASGYLGPHKSEAGAVQEQLRAISCHTRWPAGNMQVGLLNEIAWGKDHDVLDAYLSSWVASLPGHLRDTYGDSLKDTIWVPKLPPAADRPAQRPILDPTPTRTLSPNHKITTSGSKVSAMCPGCGKPFKRWPWGWDAHAAYTCPELQETEPQARKSEFLQRFAEYF